MVINMDPNNPQDTNQGQTGDTNPAGSPTGAPPADTTAPAGGIPPTQGPSVDQPPAPTSTGMPDPSSGLPTTQESEEAKPPSGQINPLAETPKPEDQGESGTGGGGGTVPPAA